MKAPSPQPRVVRVAVEPPYSVHVGAGLVGVVAQREEGWSRAFVLTDANVERLFGDIARGWPNGTIHAVPAGEDSKSFSTLERVLDALVAAGCDRRSGLIAFGGGVVGDLGGLAAGLFHRGIPYVQVPTTLLAMVDSSVGGKTAVNLAGGKNLAGLFHQPVEVYADTRFLATLPDDEYRSGLGEVVKTAVIDGPLFGRLSALQPGIARRDPDVLAEIVESCVTAKARIVARDPFEKGDRKLLNLGHTFAHAIEHAAGFGRVPHGIAVAVGLGLAAESGRIAGLGVDPGFVESLRALLRDLDVPADLDALRRRYSVSLPADALVAAMARDKKSRTGVPLYVVPFGPGAVVRDVELPESAVRAAIELAARS
ncbi:MAG: 3-dehydroquinate synthase [Planctomycetota bacterium]|nr:3-dehydroquinate synthase [Planctomycetota bacterium]